MRIFVSVLLSLCVLNAAASDLETLTREAENFVIKYSNEWKKLTPQQPQIQLMVQRHPDEVMLIGAHDSNASLDDLLAQYGNEVKIADAERKELERSTGLVAGEKAVTIKSKMGSTHQNMICYVTIFTHQGISYRIAGVVAADNEDFRSEYQDFVGRFSFIRERTDWLKKFEGAPKTTMLLGGLASLDVNRPRWSEDSLNRKTDYAYVEQASFKFITGGAWMEVRTLRSRRDAAAEFAEAQRVIQGLYKSTRPAPQKEDEPTDVPSYAFIADGKIAPRLVRCTAVVEGGYSVWVWLECLVNQGDSTQKDWNQVLKTLRLRKPDAELPAYHLERETIVGDTKPAPVIAAILEKAHELVPADMQDNLLAISPTGDRAVFSNRQGHYIEDFASHKQTTLPAELAGSTAFVFSFDGKQLAAAGAEDISIIDLETLKARKIHAVTHTLSFGPGEDEMLICTPIHSPAGRHPEYRFQTARVEVVNLKDDSRRTFLEFPMSRFTAVLTSPDRKHIALVCNRDCPRMTPRSVHAYVCAADGSHLKQLTKETEAIASLAWSPDAMQLYSLRSVSTANDEEAVPNYFDKMDIYRTSIDSGETVNMTCGAAMGKIWAAGNDLAFQLNGWDAGSATRAVYRIAPGDLLAATEGVALPPAIDQKARRKILAEAIERAGGKKKIQEVVPSPELMDSVSRAFAEAAEKITGARFDFSAAALDHFRALSESLELSQESDRTLLLGFGAYYGETLRRTCGARWKIKRLPFGDWLPGSSSKTNSLVTILLPFSDVFWASAGSERSSLLTAYDLAHRESDEQMLLVYPPSYAVEALKDETDGDYRSAFKKLDSGDIDDALDLLTRQLQKHPRNLALVQEVVSVCQATGRSEAAMAITRRAVEDGNEVTELVLSYADDIAKSDPAMALKYYRKATNANWPPADAFIKLGNMYAMRKEKALAECCWRRAFRSAAAAQKKTILKLMDVNGKIEGPDLEE
jgi:tetratricopeptide (TPR) repeat protein